MLALGLVVDREHCGIDGRARTSELRAVAREASVGERVRGEGKDGDLALAEEEGFEGREDDDAGSGGASASGTAETVQAECVSIKLNARWWTERREQTGGCTARR